MNTNLPVFLAALFLIATPAVADERANIMAQTKSALAARASSVCLFSIENKALPGLEGTYDVLISPHTPFSHWDGRCDFKDMTMKLFRQIPGSASPGYGNKVRSSSTFVDLGGDGDVDAYAPGEVGPKAEPDGLYLSILKTLFETKTKK